MDLLLLIQSLQRKLHGLAAHISVEGALVLLPLMFSLFVIQPAYAYDWVTNPQGITGVSSVNDILAKDEKGTTLGDDQLKNGVLNVSGISDNSIVYFYETNTKMFFNANSHNGTGVGLLDVGAALAVATANDVTTNRGSGYCIYTDFVNSGRNRFCYTVARHGDSFFLDRRNTNDQDAIQAWNFEEAKAANGNSLAEFYICANNISADVRGEQFSGKYYMCLNYDTENGKPEDAVNDQHSPFVLVQSETAPANAVKVIFVTRTMLKKAFDIASPYATVNNPVDASFLMRDEDFSRTQGGHGANAETRKWMLSDDAAINGERLTPDSFFPKGEDGASGNQYIGNGDPDAFCDYDRYFVVNLPSDMTGTLSQTFDIDAHNYPGWYVLSVKGVSEDEGNTFFAHLKKKTENGYEDYSNGNLYGYQQVLSTGLPKAEYYEPENTSATDMKYYNQNGTVYFSNVDQEKNPYFYKVYEAETNSQEAESNQITGSGLEYIKSIKINENDNINDGRVLHNYYNNESYSGVYINTNNTLHFNINVPAAGHYVITAILGAQNQNTTKAFDININDTIFEHLSGDETSGTVVMQSYLQQGSNVIAFTNTSNTPIEFDRLAVERGRAVSVVDPYYNLWPNVDATNLKVVNDRTTYSLRENAHNNFEIHNSQFTVNSSNVHQDATVQRDANGTYNIQNIGTGNRNKLGGSITKDVIKANGGDNELEIPFNIKEAGEYIITIYSLNNNKAYIGLSDTEGENKGKKKHWYDYDDYPQNNNDLILGFSNYKSSVTKTLAAGDQWLCIGCGEGWGPDVTHVTITKADAKVADGNIKDTGEPYITLYPQTEGQTKPTYYDFKVNVPAAGDYHAAIWYANNRTTHAKISVIKNGEETEVENIVLDPTTYKQFAARSTIAISPYRFIHLDEGDNIIRVTDMETTSTDDAPGTICLSYVVVSPGNDAVLELGVNMQKADPAKASFVKIYVPKPAEGDNSQYAIEIGVKKTSTQNPVIFDAMRVNYLGERKALVLSQNADSWQYVKDQYQLLKQTADQNHTQGSLLDDKKIALNDVSVFLVHTFNKDNWNTIVLPFNVYVDGLKQSFGENVKVATLIDSPYKTLNFKELDLDAEEYKGDNRKPVLSAGVPYLIKVPDYETSYVPVQQSYIDDAVNTTGSEGETKTNSYLSVSNATGMQSDHCFLLTANIGNTGNGDEFVYDESQFKTQDALGHANDKDGNNQSVRLVAVPYKKNLPSGVYSFNGKDINFYTGYNHSINGLRAYIADFAEGYEPSETQTTTTPAAAPPSWYAENNTTGIVKVKTDNGSNAHSSDIKVYNLNGQRVSEKDLPRGVYIKEGRKFILK